MNLNGLTNSFLELYPMPEDEPYKSRPTEGDKEVILNSLRFAELVFPESGITLCPVSHPSMTYFSTNCADILGHKYDKLTKMNIQDLFRLIHPDDVRQLVNCYSFLKTFQPMDQLIHRINFYYRVVTGNGQYNHIRQENITMQNGENSSVHIMVFTDITEKEKFYHVKMEINKKIGNKFLKVYTYNPKQQESAITPRQTDIARLITKGFTNQEIADQLNVSVFTIKNHKQQLFKKVNVRNSVELVDYFRRQSAAFG
jgi:DNA-binding CsgD family transcriptional regulator